MIYLEDLPDTVEDWFNFLSDSCGGRIWGDEMLCVTRLTTDSREAAPGHLFFALKGERFDGHDFVASVAAAGAAGAVVSRWVELPPPYTDFAQIIVRDVGIAYGEAARAWRLLNDELGVIAVAGSNGKTTTTQMIASILKTQWGDRAHSTRGNLNNLVGVPKTLLELQVNAEAAVIEAGMNHPGEMGLLARWIAPSVAVVTNAQREHQEFLSGVRETAYENGLLIAALRDPGIAVFPKADPCADVWASMAAAKNVSTITFGFEEDWAKELEAEAQAGENVIPTPYTSRVMGRTLPDGRLMIFGDHLPDMEVKLAVEGRHNQLNALAAAAAVAAIVPPEAIRKGLEAFRPVQGRGERFENAARGLLVTDDTYNANPDSVRASAEVLAEAPGRRFYILGDMGETGSEGPAFHREVGEHIRALGIEELWCVGDLSAHAAEAFGPHARHFDSVEALCAALPELPEENASVTVKASRFMKLERVVEALRARWEL